MFDASLLWLQRVPRRAAVSVDRKRYRDSSDEERDADEGDGSPRKKSRTTKSKMNPKKATPAASPMRNHNSNTAASPRQSASSAPAINVYDSNQTSRMEPAVYSPSKRTFRKTPSLQPSITYDSSNRDHFPSLRTPPRQSSASNTDESPSTWRSHCEEVSTVSQSQRPGLSPSCTLSYLPLSQRSNLPSELLSSPSPPPIDHSVPAESEIAQLVWVKISKEGQIDGDGSLWWPAQVSLRRRMGYTTHPR